MKSCLAALLLASALQATPVFVVAPACAGVASGTATTSGANTTGAVSFFAQISTYTQAANTATVTDSRGGTWHALNNGSTGFSQGAIFYSSGTGGAGHTFSATGAGGAYVTICVAAFSGPLSYDTPHQNTGTVNTGSDTQVQPGSITPSAANAVVISGTYNLTGSGTLSINAGFTLAAYTEANGIANGGIAYLIQGAAAAANPTWTETVPTGVGMGANIASFIPPPSGSSQGFVF